MAKWSGQWFRYRVFEISIALMLLTCVVYVFDNIQQRTRNAVPAENWFRINSIFVPDFEVGENPMLTYDRTILSSFRGFWVVELQRLDETSGGFVPQCSGSGLSDYDPTDYIPNNLVRLDWFMGRLCPNLQPGKYRMRASWSLRAAGWPEKTAVAYSNIFRVSAIVKSGYLVGPISPS